MTPDIRAPAQEHDGALAGVGSIVRHSVPGWLASLLLHAVFVLLVIALARLAGRPPQNLSRWVPVNVIELAERTTSPPQQNSVALPQLRAAHQQSSHANPRVATAPVRKFAAPDSMEARLQALARLRSPETNLAVLDSPGTADADSTSRDAETGATAGYSVRDYIRNQVERRWTVNLAKPGVRAMAVRIRLTMERGGKITKAEILDKARFATDAAWRDVALSARNAVLLSSPIVLPAGQSHLPSELVLQLNTKDMIH